MNAPAKPTLPSRMRRLLVIGLPIVLVCTIIVGFIWIRSDNKDASPSPFNGPRIDLDLGKVPDNLRIGLVVSYSENPNEGGQWMTDAHGAQVAAWQLAQGGKHVDIVVASDQGTQAGAKEAIRTLKQAKVSGIVAATSGPHTTFLAKEASDIGIPIIFPYATAPLDPPQGALYGLPSHADTERLLYEAAQQKNCAHLATTGRDIGIPNSATLALDDRGEITRESLDQLLKNSDTCVLIGQAGDVDIHVIRTLRANGVDAPIFLAPEISSWRTLQALTREGGLPTQVYTLGVTSSQVKAISVDGNEHTRGFTEAVNRMTSTSVKSVVDPTQDFSYHSSGVDSRSYDAFIILIAASVEAQSNDPARILDSLANVHTSTLPSLNELNPSLNKPAYMNVRVAELVDVQGQPAWVVPTQ